MEQNEYYCKQTIFDKQTWEIKIPQNADDYLNRQARFIDTSGMLFSLKYQTSLRCLTSITIRSPNQAQMTTFASASD